MLQVLVNPQQVGVVLGREDPDQFRPVNAVIPVSTVSTARRCGPEGSTDLRDDGDPLGARLRRTRWSLSGR